MESIPGFSFLSHTRFQCELDEALKIDPISLIIIGTVAMAALWKLCSFFSYKGPIRTYQVKKPAQSHPLDPKQCNHWIGAHTDEFKPLARKLIENIHHVTQRAFETSLQRSVEDFNSFLDSLSEEERTFIVVVPGTEKKSNLWVTMLAKSFFRHPPKDIIMTSHPRFQELTNNPSIKHIVVFDDASYSGNQFTLELDVLKAMENRSTTLHPIIPFMTKGALESIKTKMKTAGQPFRIATHKKMLSFYDVIGKEELSLLCRKGDSGVAFSGNLYKALTYFDHKAADFVSLCGCMISGGTLDRQVLYKPFMPKIIPPYKS